MYYSVEVYRRRWLFWPRPRRLAGLVQQTIIDTTKCDPHAVNAVYGGAQLLCQEYDQRKYDVKVVIVRGSSTPGGSGVIARKVQDMIRHVFGLSALVEFRELEWRGNVF